MQFTKDEEFARQVSQAYGEYLVTFDSDHGQIRADVFKVGEKLVAHVSYPTGLDVADVTDRYYTDLQDYAARQGYEGRLRIIHSDR